MCRHHQDVAALAARQRPRDQQGSHVPQAEGKDESDSSLVTLTNSANTKFYISEQILPANSQKIVIVSAQLKHRYWSSII